MTLARFEATRFPGGAPIVSLTLTLTSLAILPLTSSASALEEWFEIKKENNLVDATVALTRVLLGGCLLEMDKPGYKDLMAGVVECLKRRSLDVLDRIGTMEHLRIFEGIELVKNGNWTGSEGRAGFQRNSPSSWSMAVAEKLHALFKTHLLKFTVKPANFLVEARRRRPNKDMMPIMMFGVLAVSMIAIPLGFQFLAVLGGKALLLAKLALILTSIQGLKKIATSNFNYGLYQVPQNQHWHGYDRRLQYELAGDHNKYQGYQQPDSVLDLLHPLSPRSTSGYDSMQRDYD